MAVDILFLTIGAVAGCAGGFLFLNSWRRWRSWSRGEGVIVGYREDSDACFFPQVQFTLPSGEERQFESRHGSSAYPERLPVGSPVRVLYRPDSPDRAAVMSFSDFWLLPLVALGFGLMFTLVGACVRLFPGSFSQGP